MAIKVDATSLAVGLEDGSIELWERIGKDQSMYIINQKLLTSGWVRLWYKGLTPC